VLAKPSPAAWHPHFRICTCDVRVGIANLTYLRGCLFDRRWNNFLVGEAGAAGALTGLMFVAVSIDWPRVLLSKRVPVVLEGLSRSCVA